MNGKTFDLYTEGFVYNGVEYVCTVETAWDFPSGAICTVIQWVRK